MKLDLFVLDVTSKLVPNAMNRVICRSGIEVVLERDHVHHMSPCSRRRRKVNGERTIDPGDIHMPVGGTMRDSVFDEVLADKKKYRLVTTSKERGQKVHAVFINSNNW